MSPMGFKGNELNHSSDLRFLSFLREGQHKDTDIEIDLHNAESPPREQKIRGSNLA